jgi:thiamine-phosphate pyrophosphorylase
VTTPETDIPLLGSGFYAILDAGYVHPDAWPATAEALLLGGAGMLQLRAKGYPPDSVHQSALAVSRLCKAHDVPLIINDHATVARDVPDAGLHIGQDDMHPRDARAIIGRDRILGWSTHSIEQAQSAIALTEVLDYFAVGPVFPTATKPDYPSVGLDLVRAVRALQPPLPFVAIGGITLANAPAVAAARPNALVVVSAVLQAADVGAAVAAFVDLMNSPRGT